MTEHKQTWWDKNLPEKYNQFVSWVGPSSSNSKVYLRNHVIKNKYKSIIDVGCGNATEFFAYKEEYPELIYLGIDSSEFLYKKNTELGVNMLLAPGENTGLKDGHSEIVFSRHVLEHQINFRPILKEMIRIAYKEAVHIFFIAPSMVPEHIGYDSSENLYHNRYNIDDIEEFLKNENSVESFHWVPLDIEEVILFINKKAP